ncbi:MAG: FkbM family methyltransferase [Acidobacteria bacterium]|nr:FkbM family methyltransferase [Acidobacteriota bacterium]
MRGRWHRVWWGLRQEFTWGYEELVEGRWMWWVNVVAYRIMAVWPWLARTYGAPTSTRSFRLVTKRGAVVYYRSHRGDVQGIREIFIDEIYRLPSGIAPVSMLDLGANIGLATVWCGTTYPLAHIVAVEPMPDNVALLRRNILANGLSVDVVESAIGPTSGVARFSVTGTTNMGRVTSDGDIEVPISQLGDVVARVRLEPTLLKMDVEGMEGPLLTELNPEWLQRFSAVVMEMHPEYVDVAELVRAITDQGFSYTPSYESTTGYRREKRERLFLRVS